MENAAEPVGLNQLVWAQASDLFGQVRVPDLNDLVAQTLPLRLLQFLDVSRETVADDFTLRPRIAQLAELLCRLEGLLPASTIRTIHQIRYQAGQHEPRFVVRGLCFLKQLDGGVDGSVVRRGTGE